MTPKERWTRVLELCEDLQFSESPSLNKAADFTCNRCGAELRVTEVTCGNCAEKSIEELADEKQLDLEDVS